jgi:hypothetical protein
MHVSTPLPYFTFWVRVELKGEDGVRIALREGWLLCGGEDLQRVSQSSFDP